MVRKLTCETLESYGFKVIASENPDRALQLITSYEDPVQLLLTDVILPGMSSRELFEEISTGSSRFKGTVYIRLLGDHYRSSRSFG